MWPLELLHLEKQWQENDGKPFHREPRFVAGFVETVSIE